MNASFSYILSGRIIFAYLLFMLFLQCVDPIDFDVEGINQNNLVIQAKLIDGPQPVVQARVERLFAFDADSRRPVSLNTMKLIHTNGAEVQVPQAFLGNYFLTIDTTVIPVAPGQDYQLYLQTQEGEEFMSEWETLPEKAESSEITLDTITKETRANRLGIPQLDSFYQLTVEVDFSTQSQEQKARIMWQYWRPPNNIALPHPFRDDLRCSSDNTIAEDGITVFDGNTLSESEIENLAIGDFPFDFNPQDICVIVFQESISETAFDYWEKVDLLLETGGRLLEDLPGRLPTNFINLSQPEQDVFGYFYATYQDTLSF